MKRFVPCTPVKATGTFFIAVFCITMSKLFMNQKYGSGNTMPLWMKKPMRLPGRIVLAGWMSLALFIILLLNLRDRAGHALDCHVTRAPALISDALRFIAGRPFSSRHDHGRQKRGTYQPPPMLIYPAAQPRTPRLIRSRICYNFERRNVWGN